MGYGTLIHTNKKSYGLLLALLWRLWGHKSNNYVVPLLVPDDTEYTPSAMGGVYLMLGPPSAYSASIIGPRYRPQQACLHAHAVIPDWWSLSCEWTLFEWYIQKCPLLHDARQDRQGRVTWYPTVLPLKRKSRGWRKHYCREKNTPHWAEICKCTTFLAHNKA